jgi:transposase
VLLLPSSVRILLAVEATDMRNSIDGLMAIVRSDFREDVFAGHLFVFLSRRRDRVKILTWDNGGFVVYYKRLEQGRFRRVVVSDEERVARLDATQLAMLLDGIDVTRVRRPKKWSPPASAPDMGLIRQPPCTEGDGDRHAGGDVISTARWRGSKPKGNTTASGGTNTTPSAPSIPLSPPTSRR